MYIIVQLTDCSELSIVYDVALHQRPLNSEHGNLDLSSSQDGAC